MSGLLVVRPTNLKTYDALAALLTTPCASQFGSLVLGEAFAVPTPVCGSALFIPLATLA